MPDLSAPAQMSFIWATIAVIIATSVVAIVLVKLKKV